MTRTATPARPRLLVLNQYYWPGVEATAKLLADLCGALADEYDITVITGHLDSPDSQPRRETHEGVSIIRVSSTAFDRRRIVMRGINYATYLIQSIRAGITVDRPDVVLAMTDPPVIGNIALFLARRFKVPLVVISQDVFPEIALELGRLRNPLLIGLLRRSIRVYLERADRIVAIGETMRSRLEAKGAPRHRLEVIPNWADTSRIVPVEHENDWARAHDLAGKFVVMHSGNIGHAQNLDALIRAASFVRDLDRLAVVLIGTGARRHDLVRLATVLEVDRTRFLPYQDGEVLSQSLSSADVHYVGLGSGLAGYVVPSRVYGILAAGRPVIAAVDSESETAKLVSEIGCGVVIPPGRPEILARVIRQAYNGELDLAGMGRRAHEYALAKATKEIAVTRYKSLLSTLTARP